MAIDLLMLVAGAVLLYAGAVWLVAGAAALALALHIRPFVVGVTFVAFGSSAPAFVVSTIGAEEGLGGIVLGDVVGANIANLGLILGITALVGRPTVDGGLLRREIPVLLLSVLAVPLMAYDGLITRLNGAVLLVMALGFVAWCAVVARKSEAGKIGQITIQSAPAARRRALVHILTACLGIAVLAVGGKVFVNGASGLALAAGMSERAVGLTVVGFGISLPALAASLVASRRGHGAIAVANVIGSNIFNVFFILGAAALIRPIRTLRSTLELDFAVMAVFSAVAVIMLRRARNLTRAEGGLLLAGYVAYVAAVLHG